ncbi:MAG: hypothetical protein ACR2P6_11340 [Gammaproteobacteria bacterium]
MAEPEYIEASVLGRIMTAIPVMIIGGSIVWLPFAAVSLSLSLTIFLICVYCAVLNITEADKSRRLRQWPPPGSHVPTRTKISRGETVSLAVFFSYAAAVAFLWLGMVPMYIWRTANPAGGF